MKGIYFKSVFLIFSFLTLMSCSKDNLETEPVENDPVIVEPGTVSGQVVLPPNSTISLEGSSVNSELAESALDGKNYKLNAASSDFGIIYFSDKSGNERLMGLEYIGQEDHTINSSSTVLAMLMKMPVMKSLSDPGKLNFIQLLKSNPKFQETVLEFEKAFSQNKPLFDTTNTEFNDKLLSLFASASSNKSNLTSDSPNVNVLRAGREIIFQNPGKPFSQYVGVYKDDVKIDEFALGKYQYFSGSISEIINGFNYDPEVIEKSYTMKGDGEFKFKIRTGKPFVDVDDYESQKAYVENCKDVVFDNISLIVKRIPFIDLNNACIKELEGFTVSNILTYNSLLSQTNGSFTSFSSIMYQIAESTLDLAVKSNSCLKTPESTSFWSKSIKFLKFLDVISQTSSYMNSTNFLIQYAIAPAKFDVCYSVQGTSVSECSNYKGWYKGTYMLDHWGESPSTNIAYNCGKQYGESGDVYIFIGDLKSEKQIIVYYKTIINGLPNVYNKAFYSISYFDYESGPFKKQFRVLWQEQLEAAPNYNHRSFELDWLELDSEKKLISGSTGVAEKTVSPGTGGCSDHYDFLYRVNNINLEYIGNKPPIELSPIEVERINTLLSNKDLNEIIVE